MFRRVCLLLMLLVTVAHADTYVVCAGVEEYDDPAISPLKFAVDDVTALADAFRGSGVDADHCILLTSEQKRPDQRPTRINILRTLQRVREKVLKQDTFIFVFSGHGMERDGQAYLMTGDANRELLSDTALPMRLINEIITGFQAEQVLFIIDACRNDPDAGRATADARMGEGLAKDLRPRRLKSLPGHQPNTALLLACDVGQRAWEMPESEHGSFTHFLLRGLQGGARGPDGAVRLKGLSAYVTDELQSWCQRANRPAQAPRLDELKDGDFVLVPPGYTATANSILQVQTNPAGAKVYVKGPNDTGGRFIGNSPCDVPLAPNVESLVVLIQADHRREEHTFKLGAGRRATWNVTMEPVGTATTGLVELRSDPPWAEIRVGDQSLGRTPAWLALPSGEQSLQLDLADHHAQTVNVKVAVGETIDRTVRLEPVPGQVQLASDPAGAEVFVNGQATGEKTPCLLELPPGRYGVTLRLAEYAEKSLDVKVTPLNTSTPALVSLVSRYGTARISSAPSGAAIWIDGRPQDQRTPATLRLSVGDHEIELRLDGYRRQSTKVTVEPARDAPLDTVRLPLLVGRVKVVSAPVGAAIFRDNEDTGQKTPAEFELPPGDYRFELRLDDHVTQQLQVTVQADQTTTPSVVRLPEVPKGEVRVDSSPMGATVLCGGKELGRTPCTVRIPAGQQVLALRLTGYEDATVAVRVQVGQVARPSQAVLKPIPGRVMVTTQPSGAKVFVDSKDTGQRTPCTLELPPGSTKIAARKEGYLDCETTVNVVAGQTVRLPSWSLSQARILRLSIEPVDARVEINGRRIAFRGTKDIELQDTQVTIRATHPDRLTYDNVVEVAPGGPLDLHVVLAPFFNGTFEQKGDDYTMTLVVSQTGTTVTGTYGSRGSHSRWTDSLKGTCDVDAAMASGSSRGAFGPEDPWTLKWQDPRDAPAGAAPFSTVVFQRGKFTSVMTRK